MSAEHKSRERLMQELTEVKSLLTAREEQYRALSEELDRIRSKKPPERHRPPASPPDIGRRLDRGDAEYERDPTALLSGTDSLRRFIEDAPAALAMFDREIRYLSVSRRWLSDYKLGDRDLRGRSHYEVFPEVPEYWKSVHRRSLAGEIVHADRDRFQRADGSVQWLRWQVRPWHRQAGDIGGIIMFSEDITVRILAEQALRESERRWAVTLASIGDAVIATDTEGRITFLNEAAEALTGWRLAEASGRPVREVFRIVNEYTRAEVHDPVSWILRSGRIVRLPSHTVLTRKDGMEVPIDDSGAPIKDEADRIMGVVLVFRDITERKKARSTLEQSEQQLHLALQSAGGGAWDWDLTSGEAWWSPEMYALWGVDAGTRMRLDNSLAMIHELDRERVQGAVEQAIARRAEYRCEFRIVHPVRGERWMVSRGRVAGAESVQPMHFIGITLDVTERKRTEQAQRESEGRLSAILEQLPVGVGVLDREGKVILSNSVLREHFPQKLPSLDPEQMKRWKAFDGEGRLLPPHLWPGARALRGENVSPGLEFLYTGEKGRKSWILESAVPFRSADGQVIGAIAVIQDITMRKKAAKALTRRERYLQAILNTTADGFWIVGLDGRLLEVNEAYCRMSGYSRNEIQKLHIDDVDALAQPSETKTRIMRAMENGWELFESRHRRKDGSVFDVEMSVTFMDLDGGRFICFCRDISERKKAEALVRDSEQRYRSLFEASPDAILLAAPDGILHNANPAACKLFGITREEFRSLGRDGIVDAADDRMAELLEQRKRTGRFRGELRQRRKDGSVFEAEVTSTAFVDSSGKTSAWTIIRDISERKNLEAQFRQAQKMESVGRLAGGVAHDFNNKLSVILGNAEMALEAVASSEPMHGHLLEIQEAARSSADLTRQLLAFARKQTIAPRVLDLNDTVEGMLKMLRRLIGEDIHLTWIPGAGLWPVRMDPAQIDQILVNLCVNARDAIAGVGKVAIETVNVTLDDIYGADHVGFSPGRYVLLSISDDGSGMSQDTKEQIFEPFFTTKELGRGTGLGLATVYGIVKQNNGFINVYSEIDKGTTFKIYLPHHPGDRQETEAQTAAQIQTGRGETVLLVEDDAAIMRMAGEMLEKIGYRALAAGGPGEALQLAQAHDGPIHLLITDVIMPEMNGRDLAEQVTRLIPDIRTLFFSGYTANVVAHHGVLEKGVHFIQKPFSARTLAAKVREVLDKKA